MKKYLMICLLAGAMIAAAGTSWAIGTSAGTVIQNTATATYDVGPVTNLSATASTSFLVAELANVTVTLQTAGAAAVVGTLPEYDQRLYFSVQNVGNGAEAYALTVDNALAGDQFDPDNPRIFIDAGTIGSWDGTAVEVPYAGPASLPADSTLYVWVLNDVLDTPLNDGDTGLSRLVATSTHAAASTVPGTVIPGGGDDLGGGPSDLVLGPGGGAASATGTYVILRLSLVLAKSIESIVDTVSATGDQPVPGAVVTYRIDVAVTGTGTVDNLVVTDPIPANTTYVAGSLTVNGAAEDDDFAPAGVDDSGYDAGNVRIRVSFGSVAGGSPSVPIRFSVTID